MYLEKRPTSVTVISWAWIIIGALMFFSGAMAIFANNLASSNLSDIDKPLMMKLFPVMALIQMCIAAIGFYSGIRFLKLVQWARLYLEILTWIVALFLIGFMIFFFTQLSSFGVEEAPGQIDIVMYVMSSVIFLVYGFPLFFMLRALRSEKVRKAVAGNTEQAVALGQKNMANE